MKVLEVERLIINDREGRARIVLEVDRQGNPSVTLYDSTGRERVVLDVAQWTEGVDDGPHASIQVRGGLSGPAVSLDAASTGLASISVRNRDGEPGIYVGVEPDGNPTWLMYHPPLRIPSPDVGGYFRTIPEPALAARMMQPDEPHLVLMHRDGSVAFDTRDSSLG